MINNWVEAIGDTNPRYRDGRGAAGDGAGLDDGRAAPAARPATTRSTR